MKARTSGFSIMEILVIAAVLGILVAIVIPTVTRYLESGRSAACMANLRNLASAMSLFRAERNQRLWHLASTTDGGEGRIGPAQILYRYGLIQSGQELRCPSATTSASGAWLAEGTDSQEYMQHVATQYISYAVNGMAFYQSSPWKMNMRITNFSHFSGKESQTPLFMDGLVFQLNATSWQPDMRFSRLALRHNERCNVLFLDGHVESLDRHKAERLDPYGGTNPAWLRDFGVD